jgi:Tfp pilus assembly protein PilO
MKLSRNDIAALVLAVLVPTVAYFGYFKGRFRELSRLTRQQAELERQVADPDNICGRLVEGRKALRAYRSHIRRFMERITHREDAHRAVESIVSSARDAGIRIDEIRPGETVEGRTLSYLPISVSARAPFAKVYDFLLRIERGERVITVSRMETESKPHSERCTVQLELRVFFLNETDQAEGAEA